jgi:hypothetical protein
MEQVHSYCTLILYTHTVYTRTAEYGAGVGLEVIAGLNITALNSTTGSGGEGEEEESVLTQLRRVKAGALKWPTDAGALRQFPGYFVDGYMIPTGSTPLALYSTGRLNARRFVIGTTSKDGTGEWVQ